MVRGRLDLSEVLHNLDLSLSFHELEISMLVASLVDDYGELRMLGQVLVRIPLNAIK